MPQDGQAVWVESRLVIVCDEAGKPLGARGVSMDISERMQAADALQKAYDQMETRVQERTADLVAATKMADSANLAKSEFLSRMSHELRTPLNAVLGFGQLLEQRELTPRSRKDVGHILSGGRHLLSLINEILDLSRVEAGHIELSVEPISLRVIISEACALMHPLAAERAIELDDSAVELESGFVLADLQRLRQVLLNLLSNAIKYNREGGRVEIFCLPRPDGRISIAMRDTGPGISPEDLPRLFTPFERLRAATSTIEGSGLGLALSRRLVVAMGGTLNVESTLGQGTTFTVELPRANSPLKPQAAISGVSHLLYTGGKNERTYLLLYIEDNPSNLQLVEAIFETRPQWRLLTATQGSIGLDLARQHKPDLILLDVNLPDIDGKEVLKRLRQSALTREIPVIAVSADATAKQVGRLTAAGAIAYLTKPLDIVQFLETVDNLLLAMPAGISQSHNNDT
jgi:signal transduction histidine kinase/CheY-like chemotaxis protein